MELAMKKTTGITMTKKVASALLLFGGFAFEGVILTGAFSGVAAIPFMLFPAMVIVGACLMEME